MVGLNIINITNNLIPETNSSDTITESYINVDNISRIYYSTGNYTQSSDFVYLCFHPSGNTALSMLKYSNLSQLDGIVIALQGQSCKDGYSWYSSFPFQFQNPIDDASFVYAVLDRNDLLSKKIYLVGQSDGAGFCFYLSAFNDSSSLQPFAVPDISILGIISVSMGSFGLNSVNDFGNNLNSQGYLDSFPVPSVPVCMIESTNDSVSPYTGSKFSNLIASSGNTSYWKNIDPDLENTYTPNYINYFKYITSGSIDTDINSQVYTKDSSGYATSNIYRQDNSFFFFIEIIGGEHNFTGYEDSGLPPFVNFVDSVQIISNFSQNPGYVSTFANTPDIYSF